MNEYKKEDILVIIFVLAFICAVVFMCTCRDNVYDNGYGADKVRDELEHTQAAQQEETRTIEDTAESISRSEKGIDDSTKTNREIADTERKDEEIIDECQSILARVRERKATGN